MNHCVPSEGLRISENRRNTKQIAEKGRNEIVNILLKTLDLLKIVEEILSVPTLEFSGTNSVKLKNYY